MLPCRERKNAEKTRVSPPRRHFPPPPPRPRRRRQLADTHTHTPSHFTPTDYDVIPWSMNEAPGTLRLKQNLCFVGA